MPANNDDKEDDFFEQVSKMAERLGLDGRDKQKYVHEHMTRGGYNMVPSYVKNTEDNEDDDSDFFGNKPRKSSSRKSEDEGKGSGGGWF